MIYVHVSDAVRYYCVITALWLIAMLTRMIYRRIRQSGWRGKAVPQPLSIVGACALLINAIFRRFENLGQPGDWFLWLAAFGITCLLLGVLRSHRFSLNPPWSRRDTRRPRGVH